MAVLAYYQLSYEAGNRENQPVDIEKTLNVQMLKRNAAGVAQAYGQEYVRKSDVVLAGEGSGKETMYTGIFISFEPEILGIRAWPILKPP